MYIGIYTRKSIQYKMLRLDFTGTFYSDRRFKNAWEVCGGKQVKYNPYKNDTFMRENKPIHTSPTITMGTYDDRPIVWAI